MIAVIFEVQPAAAHGQDYLDLAAGLRSELEGFDGFISIERFESLSQPGKLLSLSFWRDESAITAWRNHINHRTAQQAGRSGFFKAYRIRVASVIRDYGLTERDGAPADSRDQIS